MKIALFGVTGPLGKKIIEEALSRGIQINALARSPEKLAPYENQITIITGDYFSLEDQEKTLIGADVVISAIGPPTGTKNSPNSQLYVESMQTLLELMKERGMKRFISVSGASATVKGEKMTLSRKVMRFIMRLTLPKMIQIKDSELKVLKRSPLIFTAIRPPMIVDNLKGQLHISNEKVPSMKVDSSQLASFILDIIDDAAWYRKMPFAGTK